MKGKRKAGYARAWPAKCCAKRVRVKIGTRQTCLDLFEAFTLWRELFGASMAICRKR